MGRLKVNVEVRILKQISVNTPGRNIKMGMDQTNMVEGIGDQRSLSISITEFRFFWVYLISSPNLRLKTQNP